MAGDWIPLRTDLVDDPAVLAVAAAIGLDEFAVVGRLHKLWSWANTHLTDGFAKSVTVQWVDRYVNATGFAAALLDAGWLRTRSGGIDFPHFDRWNSQGAKRRLLQNRSKQQLKAGHLDPGDGPATAGRHRGDNMATPDVAETSPREEESREEKEKKERHKTKSSPEPAKPPDSVPVVSPPADAVLSFPTVGTGPREWHLTAGQVAEWQGLFPAVAVADQCRAALAWVRADPARAKTAKGMPRFLVGWLTRQTNAGGRPPPHGGPAAPARPQPETPMETLRRIHAETQAQAAGGGP